MKGRFGGLILIAVGLLIGGIGYGIGHYLGLPVLQHAKASVNWPSVPGKVTSSSVVRKVSHDRKKGNKVSYSHNVQYSYAIEGHERVGNVVWFGDDYSSSSVSAHQAVCDRYRAGQTVTVFYDPEHPELCVLEPGAKFSSYVIYAVGWLMIGIGAIFVSGGLKSLVWPF